MPKIHLVDKFGVSGTLQSFFEGLKNFGDRPSVCSIRLF